MVQGANKTKARRKVQVRAAGGTKTRYEEVKPGKARCVTGRILPGVASGKKADIRKHSKSQRKPSRPFAGVLSSPAMRTELRSRAFFSDHNGEADDSGAFSIGRVCLKLAGRDAGKYCVIVDEKDGKLLIDGDTRRRSVNPAHLQPLTKSVKVSKGASSDAVKKALSDEGIMKA